MINYEIIVLSVAISSFDTRQVTSQMVLKVK